MKGIIGIEQALEMAVSMGVVNAKLIIPRELDVTLRNRRNQYNEVK